MHKENFCWLSISSPNCCYVSRKDKEKKLKSAAFDKQ